MKITKAIAKPENMTPPMAPLIDVVFQLLIFFMLTLRIVEPEGDFNINMPIAAPSQVQSDQINWPDIMVRMIADPQTGELAQLRMGQINLGSGDIAFQRLNGEILKIIGTEKNPFREEIEVELDPDWNLQHEYLIKAISAVTGRVEGDRVVRYIEKVKFAAPRDPPAGS